MLRGQIPDVQRDGENEPPLSEKKGLGREVRGVFFCLFMFGADISDLNGPRILWWGLFWVCFRRDRVMSTVSISAS